MVGIVRNAKKNMAYGFYEKRGIAMKVRALFLVSGLWLGLPAFLSPGAYTGERLLHISEYTERAPELKMGVEAETRTKRAAAGIPNIEIALNDEISLAFIEIPSGTFLMGSPASERERDTDEVQHQVTLTKPFYLGICEVTQEQWQAVMGTNPSKFKGGKRPVENVSWYEGGEFCRKASELTGRKLRLPTEAEWEYACRAGTTTAYNTGDTLPGDQANFAANESKDVGSSSPNSWGLYDMHGNVWEWCSDWYGGYPTSSVTDPQGPENGSFRVVRGGGWNNSATYCRSATRGKNIPGDRNNGDGFRLVMDP
jgi:formylglycine-generating enzyme required for sulfatase activity